MSIYTLWKDMMVNEYIQKRLGSINKQIQLENDYISVKISLESEWLKESRHSNMQKFILTTMEEISGFIDSENLNHVSNSPKSTSFSE